MREMLSIYFEKYQLEVKDDDFYLRDPLAVIEEYKNKLITDKSSKTVNIKW